MVVNRAVEHYLHLREQGLPHERAVDHTRLRYGILPGELIALLRESRSRFLAAAALIPAQDSEGDAERAEDALLNKMEEIMQREGLHWDRHRGLLAEKARHELGLGSVRGGTVTGRFSTTRPNR